MYPLLTDTGDGGLQGRAEANNFHLGTFEGNTTLDLIILIHWMPATTKKKKLTRPVATVPRPEIENTSARGLASARHSKPWDSPSIASKKGFSRSRAGNSNQSSQA